MEEQEKTNSEEKLEEEVKENNPKVNEIQKEQEPIPAEPKEKFDFGKQRKDRKWILSY